MRALVALLATLAVTGATAQGAEDGSHLKRTRLQSYEHPRPRAVRVIWETNSAYPLVRVRVKEGRRRVVVTVVERVPDGPTTQIAEQRAKTVKLDRRLGRRTVIDGATGEAVAPVPRGY